MQIKAAVSFCFGIFLTFQLSSAQKIDIPKFREKEKGLIKLYEDIYKAEPNDRKLSEMVFRDSLLSVLKSKGAFQFSFDSLKRVGRIVSDDEKMVLYTWNVPHRFYHNYYGIVQYYNKKEKKVYTYTLDYEPGKLKKFPQSQSDISGWYGALYYQIITKKYKGQVYYTLLGFNFNDMLSNYKIVDVLAFDKTNYPYFPQRNFMYKGKVQNRVIFEYGERITMMLEYNPEMDMIVFDHLSPARPSMEGQYQFYGPDFSYDGLKFEDGVWMLQSDVQVER